MVKCDVAIIGGGPAGSTCAALLKKYAPDAHVLVLEREVFPRDHVGESQLPAITPILEEMGVWEKVEAQGFPIKTGAMYRWGSSDDLWKLDFLVGERFQDNARPEPLKGQRRQTTFHVERSIYDKVLLDHAREMGVEVREGAKVTDVQTDGDRITGLTADGETIEATYYVDASGHTGFLRRRMGVQVNEPTELKNIAVWDYWENPEWAETVCKGGVRARIFSLGYGWIWFIPLSTTKASVGFVTHADYYKESGLSPKELYAKALAEEPFVKSIWEGAACQNKFATTKDWSFTADRLAGDNWFLVGESGGFADPILAAGMTLAQVGARELAYVLRALLVGKHDPLWLKEWYGKLSLRRVNQHIRFADYWYTANSHWSELKKFTSRIAEDAGLTLDPDEAFRWLSTGGFASDSLTSASFGSYDLGPAKAVLQQLSGNPSSWHINNTNEWRLNLLGAERVNVPLFERGEISSLKCYQRGSRLLPIQARFQLVLGALEESRDGTTVMAAIRRRVGLPADYRGANVHLQTYIEAIEMMLAEGWITGKRNKNRPMVRVIQANDVVSLEEDDSIAVQAYHTGD
jgi:flavin-dependent dehydrogenase